MMRVKDDSGNIVSGILKVADGVLIAEPGQEYNKYLQEKKRLDKINNLESEIKELKELVKSLLEKQQDK